MFVARYNERKGWRVIADYTAIGGAEVDICGAVNEIVAQQTAIAMNEAGRRVLRTQRADPDRRRS